MNTVELWIITLVLLVGGYALYLASEHGKKQKIYYERVAQEVFDELLNNLKYESKFYQVYLRDKYPFQDEIWSRSSLVVMNDLLVKDCSKYGPDGAAVYGEPDFSCHIHEETKKIYYVIGVSNFNFSSVINSNFS